MAEMLLINPRRRRKVKAKATTHRRRKNPIAAHAKKRVTHRRRKNPISHLRKHVMRRRRRNPIGGSIMGGYMGAIKDALIGGVGAVAMDVVYGQINKYLPASLQKTATVGAGDAVKAVLTVFIGTALNKVTKGASKKAAMASLTVQAYEIVKSFVPSTMTMAGLGYHVPANVIPGTNRVGPIRHGMNAYIPGGTPQLLNAYQRPGGASALLNGGNRASKREGATSFY